ncbi:hypothetical protein GB937_001333, partial [Aspergillus fischeri]
MPRWTFEPSTKSPRESGPTPEVKRPGAVLFVIDHAARSFPSEEPSEMGPIKPDQWEYNIYEYPADNWRVNDPPADRGGIWQEWIHKDAAVPHGQYLEDDDADNSKLK